MKPPVAEPAARCRDCGETLRSYQIAFDRVQTLEAEVRRLRAAWWALAWWLWCAEAGRRALYTPEREERARIRRDRAIRRTKETR